MIYSMYSLALSIALLVYGPFYMKRVKKGGNYRPDIAQRLGFSLPHIPPKKGFRLLIHCVSVGETRAVIPVIRELRSRCPSWEIYLTTTTGTGQRTAEQMGVKLDRVLYFPVDLGFVCASFLRRIRPDCICLTETEIWPNFIRAAARSRIPLILINGRISDASFRRYLLVKPLLRSLLAKFDCLCMQSGEDAERIIRLGAELGKVTVTGNIKFDLSHLSMAVQEQDLLGKRLGLREHQPVLVAGSTHPGEEETILNSFTRLLKTFPDLVLILAPRHVERAEGIARIIRGSGMSTLLWSRFSGNGGIKGGEVLLIDVIGVLARIYSMATIVIIGGSFIPHGGQNPLEPAFFGKPILFGPHMENFRSISATLTGAGAALTVSKGELFSALSSLMADDNRREGMGNAARTVIQENQGSAGRTCQAMLQAARGEVCEQ